jgi:hypothetical protein
MRFWQQLMPNHQSSGAKCCHNKVPMPELGLDYLEWEKKHKLQLGDD